MLIDKLKKINELAQRGEDGERESAKKLLNQLLEQHNLTKADLIDEEVETRYFAYDCIFESQYLMNLIEFINNKEFEFLIQKQRKKLLVDLTNLEYIQTLEAVKHYHKIYTKQLKNYKKSLLVSIIEKYNLWSPFEHKSNKKPSKKNQINWTHVFELIDNIQQPSHYKKLKQTN